MHIISIIFLIRLLFIPVNDGFILQEDSFYPALSHYTPSCSTLPDTHISSNQHIRKDKSIELNKLLNKKEQPFYKKPYLKTLLNVILLIVLYFVVLHNSHSIIRNTDNFFLKLSHKRNIFDGFSLRFENKGKTSILTRFYHFLFASKSRTSYLIWPLKGFAMISLMLLAGKIIFNKSFSILESFKEISFMSKPVYYSYLLLITISLVLLLFFVILESIKKTSWLFLPRVVIILILGLATVYVCYQMITIFLIVLFLSVFSGRLRRKVFSDNPDAEKYYHRKGFIYEPWEDENSSNIE